MQDLDEGEGRAERVEEREHLRERVQHRGFRSEGSGERFQERGFSRRVQWRGFRREGSGGSPAAARGARTPSAPEWGYTVERLRYRGYSEIKDMHRL